MNIIYYLYQYVILRFIYNKYSLLMFLNLKKNIFHKKEKNKLIFLSLFSILYKKLYTIFLHYNTKSIWANFI